MSHHTLRCYLIQQRTKAKKDSLLELNPGCYEHVLRPCVDTSLEGVHVVFFYCEGKGKFSRGKEAKTYKIILLMIYSHKNSTVWFVCF